MSFFAFNIDFCFRGKLKTIKQNLTLKALNTKMFFSSPWYTIVKWASLFQSSYDAVCLRLKNQEIKKNCAQLGDFRPFTVFSKVGHLQPSSPNQLPQMALLRKSSQLTALVTQKKQSAILFNYALPLSFYCLKY